MKDTEDKRKEFFMAMMGVGIPVLRDLYLEVISKIEDEKIRNEFVEEFNTKVLQPLPASGKRVCFGKKTYYMLLEKVGQGYDLDKEMAKIPQDGLTEEQKILLKNERDIVICAPLNFNKIVLTNTPDFIERLMDKLPQDDYTLDFQLKLEEDESTIFMYDTGIKFGLVVKSEEELHHSTRS